MRRCLEIGLRLFQLPSGYLISNCGEQLTFLHPLANGTASSGKSIGQLDESRVLRSHMDKKSGLNAHRSINRGQCGATASGRNFGHRQ